MDDVVVLEWSFSPPDYFEEMIHIVLKTYSMTIDNGKVEARIAPVVYDKEPKIRDELHAALNARFLGVQLLIHTPYKLSKPSMYRLHPDGRRDITIFPEPCAITASVGIPDIVVKDKNGNIVSDSQRDRSERKKKLAELAEKYSPQDKVVESMLASYNMAVNDPSNELVHLYEIRDALVTKFGGESIAQKTLAISSRQWSRLSRLANDDPFRQGRHRGKKLGELRDARTSELEKARSIARKMIEAYFDYLERQK
jgi:hypothetical protein